MPVSHAIQPEMISDDFEKPIHIVHTARKRDYLFQSGAESIPARQSIVHNVR
jgi:hypothetical protein